MITFVTCTLVSLAIACLTFVLCRQKPDRELRRAFEALEEEFEDQRDHVRSALGRVSRLKRSMVQSGPTPTTLEGEVESSDSVLDTAQAPGLPTGPRRLTQRQNEIQQRILARRNRAGGVM